MFQQIVHGRLDGCEVHLDRQGLHFRALWPARNSHITPSIFVPTVCWTLVRGYLDNGKQEFDLVGIQRASAHESRFQLLEPYV
jgi:hypothetical protein